MKAKTKSETKTTVAARIAGEDISSGDFVSVIHEVVELPSFLWCCSAVSLEPEEPIRIRFMPLDAGQPSKVIGICLPFVYVKTPDGAVMTIDTRQRQLVRLDEDCARRVWKAINPKKTNRK